MSRFHDILFEVSSEIRHDILNALTGGPAVVSDVSESLGISLTESSRHFSRLAQLNLIEKQVDGAYILTLLGRTVLNQLKPLMFTSKHSSYFNTHNMTLIPESFQNRIHELEDASPTYSKRVNIMRVSENVGRVALETDDNLLGIVDREIMEFVFYVEPNEGTYEILRDAQERGIKYRVLTPPSFNPAGIHKKALEIQIELIKAGTLEYRIIDSIDIFLHMSEKEASIIAFPDEEGLYDYLGFEATDERSLNWCRDLFEYYWARAKPVSLF